MSAAFVSMVDLLVFTGQVSVLNDFLTFSVITVFNFQFNFSYTAANHNGRLKTLHIVK